jgi:predicted outer membrane repeat protein
MPAHRLPPHPPTAPDPAEIALRRAEIAAVRENPWLASLYMRKLDAVRARLAELRDWLASLPRRLRRGWTRRWALTLPAAALVMALASGAALAKTDAAITVDPGGSGCTLADAIIAANTDTATGGCGAGSGPDTINFNSANGTYLLDTNYAGVPLPAITTPVTIQGNGNTTLDAEGMFIVLSVTGGGSLGIENATITGGSGSLGGGIYANIGTVNVTNATISGNSATARGAGIFVGSGSLDVTSATISGNTASIEGGGIYAGNSMASLTRATISGNSASDGGGIFAQSSTVSLTSAAITGNSAGNNGGGIFAAFSRVVLTNATISGNSAGDDGGGTLVRYSSMNVQDATVSGNSAGYGGGGIRTYRATLDLTRATVSGNSAGSSGGGIRAGLGSTVNVQSATFSGNTAGYGGGIFAAALGGTVSLTNTTVSGNSAVYLGGGIFASDCLLSVIHATISGNTAGLEGGGIYVSPGEEVDTLVEVLSSIVAQQALGADCGGTGQLDSLGYNIESATSCGFTATGDQQNVSAAQLALGPLALNAPGTTRTRAIGMGSAALNRIPVGTNGCGTAITTDQRGVSRPQLTACDVGAYELLPADPTAAQVTHFAAVPDPTGRIRITWETAAEVDVAAFRIERAPSDPPSPHSPPGPPRPHGPWTAVGSLIPARGSAAGGARYVAMDSPGVGSFAYRLTVVNADGPPAIEAPVGTVVRALRAFLPVAFTR